MEQVSHKIPLIILVNARLRTKNPAEATLYALVKAIGWLLRPPVTGFILTGIPRLGDY
jgi:hypothetical protein